MSVLLPPHSYMVALTQLSSDPLKATEYFLQLCQTSQEYCLTQACEIGDLNVLKIIQPHVDFKANRSQPIRQATYKSQEEIVLYLIPFSDQDVVGEDVFIWCAFNALPKAFDAIAQKLTASHIDMMYAHAKDSYNHASQGSAPDAPGKATHQEVMAWFQAYIDKRAMLGALTGITTAPSSMLKKL